MAELILLGGYRKGAGALVVESVKYYPLIEELLGQTKSDRTSLEDGFRRLAKILEMPYNG